MKDFSFIDEQRNADLLDAMADRAYELEEAMREADQSEWSLIEIDGQFVGFSVTNTPNQEQELYDDQA
jgi:hypothetical protein